MRVAQVPPEAWSTELLERLMQQEGTDKQHRAPGHGYVQTYAAMLGPWRTSLRAMAEIGIGTLAGGVEANVRTS